jgi:hypothetical protein
MPSLLSAPPSQGITAENSNQKRSSFVVSEHPGASLHDGLWPSNKGGPMSAYAIYNAVCKRTEAAFGFRVSPHRFRHAAGTLWSIEDPENVRGVKDLLGHVSFRGKRASAAKSRHARCAPQPGLRWLTQEFSAGSDAGTYRCARHVIGGVGRRFPVAQ